MSSKSSEKKKANDTKSKVKIDVESGIVDLKHYWPYGIKNTGKETNPNLLYLFSKNWPIELKCNCVELDFTEIKREVIYERQKLVQRFPNEMDSDKCLEEFREALNSKENINIQNNFICGKCNSQYSDNVLAEYLEYTPITIFLQGRRKFSLYLDLEAAKRIPMPSKVVSDLSSCFGKLLRLGKLATAGIDFEEDFTMTSDSNTSKFKSAPFGLEKANNETIDWMKEFESRKKTKRNKIMKRSFSDFTIKLGNSGFYVNLRETGSLLTAAEAQTTQPKQIRIKTGILTGLMNVIKRHQTIIGFIRSKEMSLKKKQSRIDDNKKKFPTILTSNATIIVCLRSKLEKWISSIEKGFNECKMVKITKEEDNEIYSCEDVIDADIILTTYEHLSKYPVIKYVPDRECLGTKKLVPFFYFQFRRVIYDNLSKKSKYFFKKYQDKDLNIESDFVWGIVKSSFDLTQAFFTTSTIKYLHYPKFMKHNVGLEQYLTGRFVKIHNFHAKLPEFAEETIMIEMNTQEKMYTRGEFYSYFNNISKLKECFDIENHLNCDTVEFNDFYGKEIRKSYVAMKEFETKIEIERQLYNMNLDNSDQISEKKFMEIFSSLFKSFAEAKSKYNFKNNCLNDLKVNYTEQKCPLCHDQIPDHNIGISDCCHVFCYKCGEEYFMEHKKCPICLQDGSLRLITKDPARDELLKKHNLHLDSGSRLRKVAGYIKGVLRDGSKPRMVFYVKNREQKEKVEKMLEELELTVSDLTEFDKADIEAAKFTIMTKRDFQSPRKLRSVSDLLIVQPFLGVKSAAEAEDDGISSVNYFSRKSPLKVVRFVLKDTIEEKLYIKTQRYRKINGQNK